MTDIKRTLLIILDGWGIGDKTASDAIYSTHPTFIDSLWNTYAHSQLLTCGENVGLPDGQMGRELPRSINRLEMRRSREPQATSIKLDHVKTADG